MKFSERWLRTWINPPVTTEVLLDQLTHAGLEVDSSVPVAADFSGVFVVEILEVGPHPSADRLRVCQVNAGQVNLQIVTNVALVAAGMKVACALEGAVLPQVLIKASELRGVLSQGMFCGYETLGLGDVKLGLVTFPPETPVGTDVRAYLELDDKSIDIELTPNRSDCLSIRGIAREVALANNLAFTEPAVTVVERRSNESFPIKVSVPDHCPSYYGRVIKKIATDAITPWWMRERLRRSGISSIHPVVDVTNYVMLEWGQPLHAFDLKSLHQQIEVRLSKTGESFVLLNGQSITLNDRTLVIADAEGPIALAGVMGGERTAVSENTVDIFLESAYFNPEYLMSQARHYGLHTDSSHRFERGIDPQLSRQALERASALLLEIVGGAAGPILEIVDTSTQTKAPSIFLRRDRIRRVLGMDIPNEQVLASLQGLGMIVDAHSQGWEVTPPSFRIDIHREIDLIEEVGRVFGYDHIPAQLPSMLLSKPIAENPVMTERALVDLLRARGYHDIMSFSFTEAKLQKMLDPDHAPFTLANPISPELAVMRSTLWCGLIDTLCYNLHRQQDRIRLVETALSFVCVDNQLLQTPQIAGLIYGSACPEQWAEPTRGVDFFDLKGDVEALLQSRGLVYEILSAEHPALHPGQSAAVYVQDQCLGYLGRLHPRIQQQLKISQPVFMFELAISGFLFQKISHYKAISKFPSIRRDLAMLLSQSVPASTVMNTVRAHAGEHLKQCRVFDVYEGEGMATDEKSLGLSLVWQSNDKTLLDEDIQTWVEAILVALAKECGARLRY